MNIKREQTPKEEYFNVITHALGLILSVPASLFLLGRTLLQGLDFRFIYYLIYCIGLITLYLASTLYHYAKDPVKKKRLKVFDHSSIYLLIAGTYTPVALITMGGNRGMEIFCIIWLIAISGIILKLFFTGRYSKISTATYVLMGWVIIIAIKPLIDSMDISGLIWLLAGGIFYTIGAIVYQRQSTMYNHTIFHVFVLVGSFCHYIVILYHTN